MTYDEKLAIIRRAAITLREHFDSVHIVAVCPGDQPEDSVRFSAGGGSWYERFGAVVETANEMGELASGARDPRDDE